MAGEWWDSGQFNLGGEAFDPNWFNVDPGMFNLDFNFDIPQFDFGQFDLGFDPGQFNYDFAMPDPLALPTLPGYGAFDMSSLTGNQPDFGAFGIPDPGMQGIGQGAPSLDFGGTSAPTMGLPTEPMAPGSDPLANLMGSPQGLGASNAFPGEPFMGLDDLRAGLGPSTPLPGGGQYANPFSSQFDLGGYEGASGAGAGTGAPMSEMERMAAFAKALRGEPKAPTAMDQVLKLGAAFGPTALGAAGLGLQSANRPQRNPLEDELLRARIASTGLQDTLARDRLQFERDNAAAAREAQMGMQASLLGGQKEMQDALIASRRPGGQGNINALLQGNPQLAALYNALTTQSTGLASGASSPEFNAMLEQIAQVDIADIQKQAQQQVAQAQEMAVRQGINPANIIAEIQQRVLQESAKARANARQTLIQQMGPGRDVFNSVGGLFGNLFQTPSAQGA